MSYSINILVVVNLDIKNLETWQVRIRNAQNIPWPALHLGKILEHHGIGVIPVIIGNSEFSLR